MNLLKNDDKKVRKLRKNSWTSGGGSFRLALALGLLYMWSTRLLFSGSC